VIISRTPFRVSFFGGGTDYPAWVEEEGGAVLSTTIDKYCYISCRELPPFFPTRHKIVWSHIETVNQIREILHPCVREGLRFLGFDDSRGLEIHHQGDLPARSGMGSSSSFAVGLIHSLRSLHKLPCGKELLAQMAIQLEQKELKENGGYQDQVAVAHGGLNLLKFLPGGEIEVKAVEISSERIKALQSRLLLYYLGFSRQSSDIASQVMATIPQRKIELRKMRGLVDVGLGILESSQDLDDFGRLLHETWQLKRQLANSVTNAVVDEVYQTALSNGALGGKLLGAGGTGFMLFYVPDDHQAKVKQALSKLLNVPFAFESNGSTIIHSSEDFSYA
jgi:D-glycero-alpha-D-manno-heptose-7-phosphate kinase